MSYKLTEPLKIGRLKYPIAKDIHRKSAPIYITQKQLNHIQIRHSKELANVGLTALDFVKCVVDNFNQIREGSNTSLLLVIYNDCLHKIAAICLNLTNDYWEIKTAQPRSTVDIKKRKLLWEK